MTNPRNTVPTVFDAVAAELVDAAENGRITSWAASGALSCRATVLGVDPDFRQATGLDKQDETLVLLTLTHEAFGEHLAKVERNRSS